MSKLRHDNNRVLHHSVDVHKTEVDRRLTWPVGRKFVHEADLFCSSINQPERGSVRFSPWASVV